MNESSSQMQTQNVMFNDQNAAYQYSVDSQPDSTFMVSDTSDATLQNFMSRPVKIASYTWATGDVLFEKFNPWTLFFENPRVINRISNFQLLRAKLKVKIILNGNGFHYGRAIASYNPLIKWDNLTVDRGFFIEDVVQASQRPHVYLDPTLSQGGELALPFFWIKNYLNIPKEEWRDMGDMTIHGMQPLKHANGATDRVTISIFAWAEDVHLSVPTSVNPGAISPQSGYEPHAGRDEYGTGPVSRPASIVARAAGALKNAPVIGMYAKAAEIGANAISSVAQIFGYARPVSVDPIMSYKPTFLGNMVNTNVEDTSQKLSTDIKQEITIDPRVTGLADADEMVIKDIACRESFLTSFPWAIDGTTESLLFSSVVDPGIHARLDTGALVDELHLPAAAYSVFPFKHWRGSMNFRFQVVASNYHKGRLKIVYEPFDYIEADATEYNTNYTYIVDIAEAKDFTVKVGWGQEYAFKEAFVPGIPQDSMFRAGAKPGHSGGSNIGNGFLSVYIVNELTVPNSLVDNDIAVNVFVSMCDDFEVAVPESDFLETCSWRRPPPPSNSIVPQSGVEEQADGETTAEPSAPMHTQTDADMAPCVEPDDHTLDVYFGETIQSFRALVKRYSLHQQLPCPVEAEPAGPVTWVSTQYYYPFYRGYDSDGFWGLGDDRYSLCKMTMLNYITPAFGGFRGGIRWKTHLWSDQSSASTFQRVQRQQNNSPNSEVLNDLDVSSNYAVALALNDASTSGNNGMVVQATKVNPVLEYEVPSYTPWRFLPAKDSNWTSRNSGQLYDNSTTPQYQWSTIIDLQPDDIFVRESYCAGADDFSCYFFLGAPILYRYTNPVAPGSGNFIDGGNEI